MTDEQKQELQQKMGQAFYADVLKLEAKVKDLNTSLDEFMRNNLSIECQRLEAVNKLSEELDRNVFLREELYREHKLRTDAEFSRDTVRAHAQAALNKYRAQDDLFEELEKLASDRQASPYLRGHDYHKGFTDAVAILGDKRAAYKAVK